MVMRILITILLLASPAVGGLTAARAVDIVSILAWPAHDAADRIGDMPPSADLFVPKE